MALPEPDRTSEEGSCTGKRERLCPGLLRRAVLLSGLATAAFFLVGCLGRWWWVAELCSHSRPQYAVALGAAGLVLLGWRRYRPALLLLLLAGLAAAPVLSLYLGGRQAPANAPALRLMSANVLTSNGDPARLLAQIDASDPDLLVLLEVNQRWLDQLAKLQETYPHHLLKPQDNNFGIAVFSRLPDTRLELEQLSATRVPSILARFDWQGQATTLIATHPLPPLGSGGARRRNEQLAAIAARTASTEGAVIVMGDLNITPWSPYFADLLQQGELVDSAQGHGPQPTWPAGSRLLRLPIDHCLHSADLVTVSRRVGTDIGSDHLPIVVELVGATK